MGPERVWLCLLPGSLGGWLHLAKARNVDGLGSCVPSSHLPCG